MPAAENFIYLAVGKKGYGKTTELRRLTRACRRALFADPEGKWEPQRAEDVTVRGAHELLALCRSERWDDPRRTFRVIYRDELEPMRRTAPGVAFAVKQCSLVCDEMAWLMVSRRAPEPLVRLVQMGRERRINLLGTTRRPQEVDAFLFDQADQVDLFHMNPGRGFDRVEELYPEQSERVRALARFEKVAYADDPHPELLGREGLDT